MNVDVMSVECRFFGGGDFGWWGFPVTAMSAYLLEYFQNKTLLSKCQTFLSTHQEF